MEFEDRSVALLAASCGETVKLFDISAEPQDPCTLSYTPFPGRNVHSLKWNHTNLVIASAGDDKRISLWRKNDQNLGFVPVSGTDSFDNIEESIMAINFSNKSSRYICSGGTGQIVRVWDIQRKRCIKWLRGHSSTITGVTYNCKDEHLASISLKGDIILHNLASGAKATELKDPNEQVLRLLDFSRVSRHLLVVSGDDGSMHLWDTISRNPKGSWLKQHSAPTAGVCFSPSNDKVIVSVGMDKRLYTFDIGCRRPTFCIPYEVPFSSLAFRDDGLIVAAGTINGRVVFYDMRGKPQPLTILYAYSEAVTSLCWQRSKPIPVTNNSCTTDVALLGCTSEDSVLMPDPLPSSTQSGDLSVSTAVEDTPFRNHLRPGGALSKLNAYHPGYTFKDDMDVFSPLVDVKPITPSLDRLVDHEGSKKDGHLSDKKLPFILSSSVRRKSPLPNDEEGEHPIFDWKTSSSNRQDDTTSLSALGTLKSTTSSNSGACSLTPREAWGGEISSDTIFNNRQTVNFTPHFGSLASGSMFSGLQDRNHVEHRVLNSSPMEDAFAATATLLEAAKNGPHFMPSPSNILIGESKVGLQALSSLPFAHKFPAYLERMGSAALSDGNSLLSSSPVVNKARSETRMELVKKLLAKADAHDSPVEQPILPKISEPGLDDVTARKDECPESSFSFQLLQHTLGEMLMSFQNCVQDDMRNIHIEILRQFHMQEMEISSVLRTVLENQAELMKEVKNLRNENKQLRQML